jgi:Zn-dependent protease/predicted transcriptional regulator
MLNGGFKLFSIFGITITLDWSWIFIFLLITWNLAAGVFPQIHPDWEPALSWSTAVLASLLFFLSILAHELAHSLVAKYRGLPVKRITLFLFGGVSNIEREPESAATELVMAIVGPITSVALGLLFLILGIATTGGGISMNDLARANPLSTLLLWLGPVNIAVGVFNLIPGFPLDGGRVLRSILWAATGNFRKASRLAAAAGQVVAWIFIIAGLSMVFGMRVPLLGTGFISGLWLAFIGWFLNNAAAASYQQVLVHDLLRGVPVTRLMRSNVPQVAPDVSVTDLVHDRMMTSDERCFPVVDGDRMIGLVCLEDVRRLPREQWETSPVVRIMTPADRLEVVTPQADADEALNRLGAKDIRQVPVVENGHLLGILRRRDILKYLQLQSQLAGV